LGGVVIRMSVLFLVSQHHGAEQVLTNLLMALRKQIVTMKTLAIFPSLGDLHGVRRLTDAGVPWTDVAECASPPVVRVDASVV
jgi:hypothetical protein